MRSQRGRRARGKLHIEMLGDDFPGETKRGAATILGQKVRAAVNKRFRGDDQPTLLFVDRGKVFYQSNGGSIMREFKAALEENDLKAYYGDNAAAQASKMQEKYKRLRTPTSRLY